MKLFTLDDWLVLRIVGRLAPCDALGVDRALREATGERAETGASAPAQ